MVSGDVGLTMRSIDMGALIGIMILYEIVIVMMRPFGTIIIVLYFIDFLELTEIIIMTT